MIANWCISIHVLGQMICVHGVTITVCKTVKHVIYGTADDTTCISHPTDLSHDLHCMMHGNVTEYSARNVSKMFIFILE